MEVKKLEIPEVLLLTPRVFEDYRGYYMESYSKRTMAEIGIDTVFVQDNHLLSAKKYTIRGIHFQNAPQAQAKLLRCTRGKILDIAVDLRKSSPTYKKYVSVVLDAETKQQIFIPKGFGHVCMTIPRCSTRWTSFIIPSLTELLHGTTRILQSIGEA